MPADPPDPQRSSIVANDNGGRDVPDQEVLQKLDGVVFQLARLIGCRMAREHFAACTAAANDNTPLRPDPAEDGAETE